MASRRLLKSPWIPLFVGFGFAGLVFWLATGHDTGAERQIMGTSASDKLEDAVSAEERATRVPALQVSAGERLTIAEEDLADEEFFALKLDLSDEYRGTGRKKVLVVSTTAGRLETYATLLPGVDSGMRLEIRRDFLSRGLYMIEVVTDGGHPHHIRRFVLEIE